MAPLGRKRPVVELTERFLNWRETEREREGFVPPMCGRAKQRFCHNGAFCANKDCQVVIPFADFLCEFTAAIAAIISISKHRSRWFHFSRNVMSTEYLRECSCLRCMLIIRGRN